MDEDDTAPIGYRNPPKKHRFQKGKSGNPNGRRKRTIDFFGDAREILAGNVTGRVKGKSITVPVVRAMFRSTCREALKGDNAALRRVIESLLVLVPKAQLKAEEAALEKQELRAFYIKLYGSAEGFDRPHPKPEKRTPEEEAEIKRKVAQMRKELLKEANR